MTKKKTSGGKATNAGIEYQARTCAWFSVLALSESPIQQRFELSAEVGIQQMWFEPDAAVDDVIVETSSGGFLFGQVKRNLTLSGRQNSRFAKALDQLLKQYEDLRDKEDGIRPWERPLEVSRDRLLLLVSANSSAPVRTALPRVLSRIRARANDSPPSDFAETADEKRILNSLLSLLRTLWKQYRGSQVPDADVLEFLELCHVATVAVEKGEPDEQLCLNLLKGFVLEHSDAASAAWSSLISHSVTAASDRGYENTQSLRSYLASQNVILKTARSLENDVAQLQSYTQKLLTDLRSTSEIKFGDSSLSIRRDITQSLESAVESGPLIVVGEPGSGKSAVLYEFAKSQQSKNLDVVFIAVDRIVATDERSLSASLGLSADVEEVLLGWSSTKPGLIIVDALDAARSEVTAAVLRRVLERILRFQSRWRVIASMRKFDLRYSPDMQQLFRGSPPTEFVDLSFPDLRHVNVGSLSDQELQQLSPQAPRLHQFIASCPVALKNLIRVPFNLRLLSELLGQGIEEAELSPIRAQTELLDRYWDYLILHTPQGADDREALLKAVTTEMVANRSLRVDRHRLWESEFNVSLDALTQLLSANVLAEWQASADATPNRNLLVFAHHILFDYAASRLILRPGSDPSGIVERLTAERDLVVVLRPSLTMHFQYLWGLDESRSTFWKTAVHLASADAVPEVAKLIGPHVASESASCFEDFNVLLRSLGKQAPDVQPPESIVVRHLFGAVLAQQVAAQDTPNRLDMWADTIHAVSEHFDDLILLYCTRPFLFWITEDVEALSDHALKAINAAARRFLATAWSVDQYDSGLVMIGFRATCRTMSAAPEKSVQLLSQAIESQHVHDLGHQELAWLADEIPAIAECDPAFAAAIYVSAFEYEDKSDDKTPLGRSQILPLVSNRRQDYAHAWYRLEAKFPKLLFIDLGAAVSAAVGSVTGYVNREHPPTTSNDLKTHKIQFGSREAELTEDWSYIWNSADTRHRDSALKLLGHIESFFAEISDKYHFERATRTVIDTLVGSAKKAAIWSWFLGFAADFPSSLGVAASPLLTNRPILTCLDTTTAAGNLLSAVFHLLATDDRQNIETLILSLADSPEPSKAETAARNRLLACLDRDHLTRDESRRILGELDKEGQTPTNEPPFSIVSSSKKYTSEDYLRDLGVPVEEEIHRKLLEHEDRLKDFTKQFSNTDLSEQDYLDSLSAFTDMRSALNDVETAHTESVAHAFGVLADACETVAGRAKGLERTAATELLRDVLLEASVHEIPEYDKESDDAFNSSQGWGSPSPRISAGAGLTALARFTDFADSQVLAAIENLSRDVVPHVRFQVAVRLTCLYKTANDLMWQIVRYFCEQEANRGVIDGAVSHPLPSLSGPHADVTVPLLTTILRRVKSGPGADRVIEHAFSVLLDLYIWRDNVAAHEQISGLLSDVQRNAGVISSLLYRPREALSHAEIDQPPDSDEHRVRERAFDFLSTTLFSVTKEFRFLLSDECPQNVRESKETRDLLISLLQIADTIGREVYFASGAHKERTRDVGLEERRPSPEQRRFYDEAESLIDSLIELQQTSIAHHILETLEYFIPYRPKSVFHKVHSTIVGAESSGYQFESLGLTLVVRIVERYLAEYRHLLSDDTEMRARLVEILDVFVRAGWPEARQLTFRLSDIYS